MFSFFRELFRDIAKRKQVKKALSESEERYRTIFDTTGAATLITEEDYTISLVNSEFEKISGYSKEEIEGRKKWTEFFPIDYQEIMKEYHRLRGADPDSTPRNYETQLVNSQGKTRVIYLTVNMIPGTRQSVASLTDITKYKRAVKALQNQSLFLQRLIDNIPSPVYYKDVNGIYQGCNKAYAAVLGRDKNEIVGKSIYDLTPLDLADGCHRKDEALLRDLGVQVYESSVLYSDGVRHSAIINKAAYYNTDGTMAGLIGVISDIEERKKAEEELRQSEALIRSIVESPQNIRTFSLDTNYRYIFFNKAYHEMMKNIWEIDIKLGISALEYITNPDDKENAAANFNRAMSGENFSVIEEYCNEELDCSYWENIYSPIVIETGKTIGVTVFCSDISERILAERKLLAANQKLQDIIDFLPDATLVLNKEGKVIAWNKAIEKMTGVNKEEMLGRGEYAYAVPFYGEPRPILIDLLLRPEKDIGDKYDHLVRSGSTLITEKDVPFTYQGKGAYLWGIATLLLDSDGNVTGAIESIRDITGHKNTVEALKLSEQRFSQIFDNNPSLLFISTMQEGRFVMVNNRFLQATGYSREDIIGRTVTDIGFWVKPDRAEAIRLLQENGLVNNMECIFREKSGEATIGLFSAQIMPFGDEQVILSVLNDISERKRLEEEMSRLERMNLIGEMAAGIGHEIRNPMTTVRGFLQMLGEKQECRKFREYYNLMLEELDRANSIISEYLSLAKNKAVSKKYHNLNQILKALHPLIQADAMRTEMYVHMAPGDIPNLLLDEKEIRQLILNMVRNGLEAMTPGGKITLKTFMEGDQVVLAVQDQGAGIEPDVLEKMGTPFFTTKDSGTGLGLAVCNSIALRQNASIRVESGPTGTTFYVTFTPQVNSSS
ncbi:MAG: PAS domain S-box protein [Desulfotomaculaceae bacterium]|nr:PAS domain S-box protein [Desulfotomaculaceae bacterium]MDD4766981.1 PAS domain S-box protein [Desulfotomaculaceae bacterium]